MNNNLWVAYDSAIPVYAIINNGKMLFYKLAEYLDCSMSFPISGKQIGYGWRFKQVFADS